MTSSTGERSAPAERRSLLRGQCDTPKMRADEAERLVAPR